MVICARGGSRNWGEKNIRRSDKAIKRQTSRPIWYWDLLQRNKENESMTPNLSDNLLDFVNFYWVVICKIGIQLYYK